MLQALDRNIGTDSLMWLFLAFFILHDFEEILAIEPWMKRHAQEIAGRVPKPLRPVFARMSGLKSYQFAVAVLFEFLVFIPVTYAAVEKGWMAAFLGINILLFLHVFTHLGQSLLLRRYTIGVITAVLLALPYSLYLFYRLTSEHLVTWHQLYASLPYALIPLPLVLLGQLAGKRWLP